MSLNLFTSRTHRKRKTVDFYVNTKRPYSFQLLIMFLQHCTHDRPHLSARLADVQPHPVVMRGTGSPHSPFSLLFAHRDIVVCGSVLAWSAPSVGSAWQASANSFDKSDPTSGKGNWGEVINKAQSSKACLHSSWVFGQTRIIFRSVRKWPYACP